MEMLLMGACLSLVGLAVAWLVFGAGVRGAEQTGSAEPSQHKRAATAAVSPTRFFIDQPTTPVARRNRVPIEALLLQLESHVRLEQAAAQSFLESPNSSLLHSRTISPLVS